MSLDNNRLKELVNYDPISGVFTLAMSRPGHRIGQICGARDPQGYVRIKLDGRSYAAHRLAWLYVTGRWPDDEVDHENRNGMDNRWSNLRAATRGQNQQNRAIRKDNKSGFPGVTLCPVTKRWRARISKDRKQYFLGLFDDPAQAALAYRTAKQSLHTFHPQVSA